MKSSALRAQLPYAESMASCCCSAFIANRPSGRSKSKSSKSGFGLHVAGTCAGRSGGLASTRQSSPRALPLSTSITGMCLVIVVPWTTFIVSTAGLSASDTRKKSMVVSAPAAL